MLLDDLKSIQSEHGFLPRESLLDLSRRKSIPLYEIEAIASFYPHFRATPPPTLEVAVCTDMSCHLAGAAGLEEEIRREVERRTGAPAHGDRKGVDGRSRRNGESSSSAHSGVGAAATADAWRAVAPDAQAPAIEVRTVSCLGLCDRAPACAFNDEPVGDVTIDRVRAYLERGEPAAHNVGPRVGSEGAASASGPRIDPYLESGGERYGAFRGLLSGGEPEAVIASLKVSGLRGLGGAGFPAGTKWELTRKAEGRPKYVVCNADESEPGTFKDRDVLERYPHLVLEGMLIGAWVVGAQRATVFLRHEYHTAQRRLAEAIRELASQGLIGHDILGSGFACEMDLFVSAGGYICGEETALLEALEGKRAEPRNKPPFPGVVGLHGKPTLMNNVETFAMVPGIVRQGPEWYRGFGENGGVGLKYFALSGHVNRPGVYESWLGIPARRFIEEYGGGMRGDRALKAFAPGGASSGFLPAGLADLPLDFKPLAEAGSMLGTGAVVAVAEGTCMLDLALNVVRFFRNESCGKCVPCREGTEELVTILERIRVGRGSAGDLTLIDELADTMAMTSICGLGQAAPLPITSVIRHWREEVDAHVLDGRCPEGVCS